MLWHRPTPALVRSSIAIAGRHVYFGCDDGNVYAVERLWGEKAWELKTGGPVASSPWVADGVLYIGSEDSGIYALE